MKVRESGIPEEELWATFFNPEVIFDKLNLTSANISVVEYGCGYGTFTVPAAKRISGYLYAFDMEPEMIEATQAKVETVGLTNVRVIQRDIVANGTGIPDSNADYVMLFNILHTDHPLGLLQEAFRILAPGGKVGIIHWNYDPATPRGPSMEIRPRPEQCRSWIEQSGFRVLHPGILDLPPYHYGIVAKKPN